ncbi:MAG TPA: nicotinate-nucleotide--dimethylbenzimidazole phosphoribosyltransferase [Puia sp.]|jgi:nicotinate-nucleotide--dimethylbenzimidazole phosphoribosyltransferase
MNNENRVLQEKLQHLIDNKTKPLGALGRLEELALQIGVIQGVVRPEIRKPAILVFAGDHGIAATGLVNPYPQSVTAQMVLNFIAGGAAINVFCRQHELGLVVVDAGVNFDFDAGVISDQPTPGKLLSRKIAHGTRNYLEEDAMSAEQVQQALEAGAEIVRDLFAQGCNCIGLGEMGIGNTSSASLIMSFVTGIPVEECVGRGTGVNDEQLEKKKETLREVFRRHLPAVAATPGSLSILQKVGGFEIAMMTGVYLEAARLKMIILVDGFITTSALLLAGLLDAQVQEHCIFSHTSGESGHVKMLEYLGASPLLDLHMRLGEGSGAAMAYPLVQSAVLFLREMASFESAGVDRG